MVLIGEAELSMVNEGTGTVNVYFAEIDPRSQSPADPRSQATAVFSPRDYCHQFFFIFHAFLNMNIQYTKSRISLINGQI